MQVKFLKCQDIPLTGTKSCQDAALCIYFNKLKPELFFPGVSFGFSVHLENCQALSAETSVSRGFTAASPVKEDVLWNILEVWKSFFFFALSLSPCFFSAQTTSLNHVPSQKLLVHCSKNSNKTTVQEKHIKSQTMSFIMHTELPFKCYCCTKKP